ncbi:MAG: hypothetical protein Q7R70_03165 [Candidatus Diapherotrites archaeon]|nr:hypothetical protein [Candidatus Diapherotrites archaeon]
MNSKGQSALEYLMTYGWALVVIVIVVAALFAFGVFNTPANCTQFGGRLLLKDYAIQATGISLAIQNGSSGTMSDLNASGDLGAGLMGSTSLSRSADTNAVFTSPIAAGSTYVMSISYTANGISHTESTTCVAGTV